LGHETPPKLGWTNIQRTRAVKDREASGGRQCNQKGFFPVSGRRRWKKKKKRPAKKDGNNEKPCSKWQVKFQRKQKAERVLRKTTLHE